MTTEFMRDLLTKREKSQLSIRNVRMEFIMMYMRQCVHFQIAMVDILS